MASSKTKNAPETNGDKQKRGKAEPNLALRLGPFNDVVRKTMDQISGTQAAIDELRTQFSQYINDVEVLPSIQEQHETMKMQLSEKDANITRLNNALDVLTERSSEKDRALEEKERHIEAQSHALENSIRKLNSDKAEWNKRSKLLEAEQKLASKKELEKLRNEIEKAQKQREADDAEKLTNLETQNESLSERVKQLDIDLLQSRDKYNEKKNWWKSVTHVLSTEKQKLEAKVDELQHELAFETRPTEYYHKRFHQVFQDIVNLSRLYFQTLPAGAPAMEFEEIKRRLVASDPMFNSIPISETQESADLRIAHARRVISATIIRIVWQPFSSERTSENDGIAVILEEISKTLAIEGGRSESAWRALTFRGLHGLSSNSSEWAGSVTKEIVKVLMPLLTDSAVEAFQKDLARIVQFSIELWHEVQRDAATMTVMSDLDPGDKTAWRPSDLEEDWPHPEDKPIHSDRSILCLFPRILRPVPNEESTAVLEIVHPGSGLSQDSPLAHKGRLDQEELEKYMQAMRADYMNRKQSHSRRSSLAQPSSAMTQQKRLEFS